MCGVPVKSQIKAFIMTIAKILRTFKLDVFVLNHAAFIQEVVPITS